MGVIADRGAQGRGAYRSDVGLSANSAPEATTSAVFRPVLGMVVFGEERQDGVGDLLRVLRVGVVAGVLDHLVAAQTGW